MAKVVKAVAIGALIGFTGGLLLPAIGLSAPFVTAFGITNVALASAAGMAFYAGLGAVASQFLTKKASSMSEARERLNISLDPQVLGKWVFGETAMGTDLVYMEQYTDDQYVGQVVAAAAHKIHSFDSLYVNDELVSFDGFGAATGDYADTLWAQTNLGTETQSAISDAMGTVWPSTAEGLGIAHYRLLWKLGQTKTKSGLPSRITLVGKGAPVYDPRLDTTVGGSGSHRANDQSTWEYTNSGDDIGANWALVVLFYLLGWKNNGKLVFGMGVDPADIDYDQVIASANICDETIDSKPRFRVGGMFATSNEHESIISQLEAAIGGSIAFVGGKYYIWVPNDDLTTFNSIVETDILRNTGVEFIPSGPIEDLYNTARGRYISPADLYQPIMYPDVVESSAVTYDGRERVMDRDFAIIQDVEIAERVARHMVRRSRFTGTWRFSMGPKGLLFKPFDITTLNCQETDYDTITVRIINMVFSPTGIVRIECVEEDTSIYDTSAALGTPITQNDPTGMDPATIIPLTGLAATAITVSGSKGTSRVGYSITWNDPGVFVERTEIRLKPTAGSVWSFIAPTDITVTQTIILNFEPGTEYELQARHITIFGVPSDWESIVGTTDTAGLTYYDDIVHYYYQASAPSGVGEKNNDVWVDSDDNKPYRRIAGVWTDIQDDDAAGALATADFDSTLQGKLSSGVATVLAGVGQDWRLTVNTTSIVAQHKDASLSSVGAYSGALRTGVMLTSAGIAMGYNRKSDGNWVSAVSIDATGNIAILGDISATTGTFAGNISTTGYLKASGTTLISGDLATIIATPTSGAYALYGVTTDNYAALDATNTGSGPGIFGASSGTNGYGIIAFSSNTAAAPALAAWNTTGACVELIGTGHIIGDAVFEDDVTVWDNLAIGSASLTGVNNICIGVGSAGTLTANQIQIYADDTSDATTSFGLVCEQSVVAGTGAFTGIHQLKVTINAVEYWLPLQVV